MIYRILQNLFQMWSFCPIQAPNVYFILLNFRSLISHPFFQQFLLTTVLVNLVSKDDTSMKKISKLYIYILSNYTFKIHVFRYLFRQVLLRTGRPHFQYPILILAINFCHMTLLLKKRITMVKVYFSFARFNIGLLNWARWPTELPTGGG